MSLYYYLFMYFFTYLECIFSEFFSVLPKMQEKYTLKKRINYLDIFVFHFNIFTDCGATILKWQIHMDGSKCAALPPLPQPEIQRTAHWDKKKSVSFWEIKKNGQKMNEQSQDIQSVTR